MSDEPFLTIVIPTYHRAALLKRCLESVLASSAREIEVLVRHLASMYPQMYVVLSALREHPALYSKELFVAHTEGNRVFWNYTVDKMVVWKIALIKDCLAGPRWTKEREVLVQQIVR